ncbi:methionine synthase I [Rhodobacter sp. TJ_12]|uniref:holin family protein n=1 Tax=Rhodobacter sp. TJ_12 TaxID=2029399 RepID=UPI001CBC94D4|nr:holin family protein [Rhodobacter sp. TJ_12]MBZ4022797.1 methionine synthase I [Rhodobacter sp. TJ_12]
MGLIGKILGGAGGTRALGAAVTSVAETFTPHATKQLELENAAYQAALAEHGAEFAQARTGGFDRFVDGLNRLPRPMLALGTLGLFVYAMVDPIGFAQRMVGLTHVPEPLWWLLGAIVGFYFGAREAHYLRRRPPTPPAPKPEAAAVANPALSELLGKAAG